MGIDERGTIVRIQQIRREVMEPTIAEHRGHLIKTMGDGFLAMFDSPVEAVRCAIVFQETMVRRNIGIPKPQWIQFRIGVNLGDVILEDADVFGEGVNIATRLEQLAEAGGVYISGGVYEQIKYKVVCGYQSLGDRRVKNITDPVPIYRVLSDPAAVARAARQARSVRLLVALTTLAVVSGLAGWFVWRLQAVERIRTASLAANPAVPTPSTPAAPEPPSAREAVETKVPQTRAPETTHPAETAKDQQQTALLVTPPPPPRQAAPAPIPPEPEMVQLPGGAFRMGGKDDPSELPVHRVSVPAFLISKYPITAGQWSACVAAHVCTATTPADDREPASNLSWTDAETFVAWLSETTHKSYRLPTEAEWEYAARAGTDTAYWWGEKIRPGVADCKGCGGAYDPQHPAKVGSFPPNPFGLYDMAGGVSEWVADCWHSNYVGAPTDGSAWRSPNCEEHVLRGGSWKNDPSYLRSSSREYYDSDVRYYTHGFRVARSP